MEQECVRKYWKLIAQIDPSIRDIYGEKNGRFFTDMNEKIFEEIMDEVDGLKLIEQLITEDLRTD